MQPESRELFPAKIRVRDVTTEKWSEKCSIADFEDKK